MIKLLPKELENKIPAYYSGENIPLKDKVVVCKFFSSLSNWTWYVTEYDPENHIFFGLVDGFEKEWGDFSLDEFEQINKERGFQFIDRDLYWEPKKISEIEGLEGAY